MSQSLPPPVPKSKTIVRELPLLRRARLMAIFYVLIYYMALLLLEPPYNRILSNVLSPLGVIASIWLLGCGLRYQQGKLRRLWSLFFLGTLMYGTGEFIWRYNDLFVWKGLVPPAVTLADLFYVPLPFLFGAAIFSFLRRHRALLTLRSAFDILIIMTTASTLNWHFIFHPLVEQSSIEGIRAALMLLYPIGTLGCMMGALFMYYSSLSLGYRNRSLLYLVFAAGLWCIAIQLYVMKTLQGTYASGALIDPLWPAGLFMLALACLSAVDHPLEEASDQREFRSGLELGLGSQPYLPYLAFILLLCVVMFAAPRLDGLMLGVLLSLTLIIVRQFLTLTDNRRLFVLLKQSNEKLERQGRRLQLQQQELESAMQELQRLNLLKEIEARTDYLTGLMNRRSIQEKMSKALGKAAQAGEPFSILLLDLDHFKQINDRFGHETGDRVLQAFSALLQKEARTGDGIGRFGGEEFIIMLPGASADDAVVVAERLRMKTEALMLGYREDLSITASIGAASWHGPGEDLHSLLVRADQALYEAKHLGRNRVVLQE